ncbi:MAG: lysophospholipid acyltransferase family protein [Desulfatibacillaceae bacterium]|nr:lysophospholipid acyltransferase family protein [Desulfatibacillaceae bacterium]
MKGIIEPHTGVRPDLKWRAVGILGKAAIDAICSTCHIDFADPYGVRSLMDKKRFITAFWHSRILVVSYAHQGFGGSIMVSRSQDGEIIAQIIRRQGHYPVRGSSRHGGDQALESLVQRLLKTHHPGVMIPDGPQGPRHKARSGVITLAARTGYPIVPITFGAKNIKVFASWDRFVMPLPGTRCIVAYGRPVTVPQNPDSALVEGKRQMLEDELNRITDGCDRYFNHKI